MPTYNNALFSPPAPLAHVTLRNRDTGETRADVPMLLDTGADITLIPQNIAEELGLAVISGKTYELVGFDGSASVAPTVQSELVLLNRVFRGQFLLVAQDWGIIGRNILNALPILFDGPHQSWEIHKQG